MIKKLKIIENNDLEDMVSRMELTYSNIEFILDVIYILPQHLSDILYQLKYMKLVILISC